MGKGETKNAVYKRGKSKRVRVRTLFVERLS